MAAFLELQGHAATEATIQVPSIGAWVADVSFADGFFPSGRVTLKIGAASFVGTVDAQFSGIFGSKSQIRIKAGAGSWARVAPAKHWHNDAGVKLSSVLADTAGSVGETLGAFADSRIGIDFTRLGPPAPARRVLSILAPVWFVDYAGVTQIGPRPIADATAYTLLTFDPGSNAGELTADDVRAVPVGAVVRDRLDRPLTVRHLVIHAGNAGARLSIWGTT